MIETMSSFALNKAPIFKILHKLDPIQIRTLDKEITVAVFKVLKVVFIGVGGKANSNLIILILNMNNNKAKVMT